MKEWVNGLKHHDLLQRAGEQLLEVSNCNQRRLKPRSRTMLNLDHIRRLLGNPAMTDEQVTRLRDDLYCFAQFSIAVYLRERREKRDKATRLCQEGVELG
jgi:hypothetical protein